MPNSAAAALKNGLLLMRPAAVIASSVVIIFSGVYPLFTDPAVPTDRVLTAAALLLVGCLLIHGLLTHALNDYTDYRSGTDERSPALLSGGSRVIQNGRISPEALGRFGFGLTAVLLIGAGVLAAVGQIRLAVLLVIGIWGAVSYSAAPLRLSYVPFAGEWLSTFPSTFALGLGGAWLLLDDLPLWAVQNAWINALYCISWVMVHHIPDLEADRGASPVKRTSVVWAADRFGPAFARLPAIAYFALIGVSALWFAGTGRPIAAGIVLVAAALSVYWLARVDVQDAAAVTACEKKMLLTAMVLAIGLGIFH